MEFSYTTRYSEKTLKKFGKIVKKSDRNAYINTDKGIYDLIKVKARWMVYNRYLRYLYS